MILSKHFNPRPPWGGRHSDYLVVVKIKYHFNPRPPWGGRPNFPISVHLHVDFNPRPPWGGRLFYCPFYYLDYVFQSTPSVGRATFDRLAHNLEYFISIHALRGEGDPFVDAVAVKHRCISIHALRGEGDCKNIQICNAMLVHSAYKTIYFCDSCAFCLA